MLWELVKAVILGIVEGLTEFLPVSSTGHLILVNQWLAYSPEFTVLFDVFIQLGAILAVILYFRNDIFPPNPAHMIKKEFLLFWSKILTAFAPAVVFGLLLADFIEEQLFNVLTVSIALFVGGILLLVLDGRKRTSRVFSVQEMSYQTALFIGLFQCLAMIPGTSRSAATIIGALVLGCSRKLAAEFSFYLAIPTILAASVYSMVKNQAHFSVDNFLILSTGFVVTFFVAMGVIKFLMNFIKKHSFVAFGYYRIVLSIIFFLWLYHQ